MSAIRNKTAITGVGWSELTKKSGKGVLSLAVQAILAAIADAGLEPTDVDGLVTYHWGPRDTPAPPEVADALGLEECRMSFCDSSGGAWSCSAIAAAAMAVHAGLCRHVVVYRAANARSAPILGLDHDLWPSGQRPWNEPFGATNAAATYGLHVSSYLAEFGLDNADFADLAVLQRANAGLNTKALMRTPLTVAEHQASPWIVWPFRLLDCSVWNDGAMAVVVSRADDAERMSQSPVLIRAVQGGTIGAPVRARASTHPWELNALRASPRLYEDAGISPTDIDVAEIYDPFTGMALLHLEQFGLAPLGRAPDAVRDGDFSLDGRVAVNTHGGNLSEGNLVGLGHVVEAVQQLRTGGVRDDLCQGAHDFDRRHCRQVRDPELALVVGESGDSSLVLGRSA